MLQQAPCLLDLLLLLLGLQLSLHLHLLLMMAAVMMTWSRTM
jgi:hypothetical protein